MGSPGGTNYGHVTRDYVLPSLPASTRALLDVGCGDGGFLRTVKSSGVPVAWGIEPDERAAGAAAQHGDRVIKGRFPDDMPADAPAFDVVSFTDVLEHLEDPWTVLRRTKKLLTPDGHVLASIPNVRYFTVLHGLLLKRDFTYTDQGVLDKTHLRFFTRRTMVDLFEASGYEVVSCRPRPPSRAPRARLMALLLGADVRVKQFVLLARPA